jgi:hypothetical protein
MAANAIDSKPGFGCKDQYIMQREGWCTALRPVCKKEATSLKYPGFRASLQELMW